MSETTAGLKKCGNCISWGLTVMALSLFSGCGTEADNSLPAALNQPQSTHDEALRSTPRVDAAVSAEAQPMLATLQTFLSVRNQQLLTGTDTVSTSELQNLSENMARRVAQDNATLRGFRDRLAQLGERYAGFKTDVRLISTRSEQGKLIAQVEELTRFDYVKVRGDEPPYTAFRVEREFTLSQRGASWIIEDVRLIDPSGPAPINEGVTLSETGPEPREAALMPHSDIEKSDSVLALAGSLKRTEGPLDVTPFYNYSAMANYASTWALSRNPAYRSFPNDCTNFISQAVYAGGWIMVSGFYQSSSAWWYNSLNQSYTWAGAQNWYWFATGSGRTSYLGNVWYLAIADVLQMDFDRNSSIDHTMMVTYTTSNERYLSYHTMDTLNRSLSSIIAAYPSAWYYAHRT